MQILHAGITENLIYCIEVALEWRLCERINALNVYKTIILHYIIYDFQLFD